MPVSNAYRISLNSLRAYYYFSKTLGAQTIQGGKLIKGVNYCFPNFSDLIFLILKVVFYVKYTHLVLFSDKIHII